MVQVIVEVYEIIKMKQFFKRLMIFKRIEYQENYK